MPDRNAVAAHYTQGGLLDTIRAGVEALGKTPQTVTLDDLGPAEEFHIGGRAATEQFLDPIGITLDDHVLDVGCGLGGSSRFVANRYGARVTGIDLTAEYVETGNALNTWVGLDGRVSLDQGNATATPYADATFDKAYMLHVGMNIADKEALAQELFRILKPGGTAAIYDIMRTGDGDLEFPVPWATTAEGSAVAAPADYKAALEAAGFTIAGERDRRNFALDFFERMRAAAASAKGPPPLGLHIVMGNTAPVKLKNMIDNIAAGRIAPVEIVADKSG
jgi:SAM-dependent methyltransferase